MTNRRWWIIGAIALVVVAAVATVVLVRVVPDKADTDCAKVHQLIEYNLAHNKAVAAQSDPDHMTETSLSDYRAWAAQLKAYSDGMVDPGLSTHARRLAELADQTVAVIALARDDAARSPVPGPPPWAKRYAELNVEFSSELRTLAQACIA